MWKPTDLAYEISLVVAPGRGLDETYGFRSAFPTFVPTELSGFPAVRVSPEGGVSCEFVVGISDSDVVDVEAGGLGGPKRDWCELASEMFDLLVVSASRSQG
ncbi:hypothetical protein GCM10009836_27290 [Pseudonocardia ailaonensis]|uniref:Uncharacterized protein n=2 Tax=Pseudonocardia ailaonensis TaxID=367279 RepID=A0ABN2N3B0_9PSEU